MEIAGYIASALVGVSMGLIGGGGSILTIPILVYLFSISPTLAISYSLFIVGFTSLVGAFNNYRRGLVNFKTVFLFGSSSVATVFTVRKFIIPFLPEVFFKIASFNITHSLFVMVVFAVLMLAASTSMIRNKQAQATNAKKKPLILVIYGVLIGLVTGFLGAGGGFLLIPALVILMRLPMKEAIGTSLLIIALNSLIGFTGDIGHHAIDWKFLLIVTGIAIAGIFIGGHFSQQVNSEKLKKGFGWFVLIMGIYIIVKEIVF
jgi:hypothetical protein